MSVNSNTHYLTLYITAGNYYMKLLHYLTWILCLVYLHLASSYRHSSSNSASSFISSSDFHSSFQDLPSTCKTYCYKTWILKQALSFTRNFYIKNKRIDSFKFAEKIQRCKTVLLLFIHEIIKIKEKNLFAQTVLSYLTICISGQTEHSSVPRLFIFPHPNLSSIAVK